jgi:SnoaL-like domain
VNKATQNDFDQQYLKTWTEPDSILRRAIIDQLWSPDGRMSVSSLGVTIEGVDEIAQHVARVHDEQIVGKGLGFSYDQHVESGDSLLLRWSMTAPTGQVVGRGVDVILFDADGSISSVYMFMGVD